MGAVTDPPPLRSGVMGWDLGVLFVAMGQGCGAEFGGPHWMLWE